MLCIGTAEVKEYGSTATMDVGIVRYFTYQVVDVRFDCTAKYEDENAADLTSIMSLSSCGHQSIVGEDVCTKSMQYWHSSFVKKLSVAKTVRGCRRNRCM